MRTRKHAQYAEDAARTQTVPFLSPHTHIGASVRDATSEKKTPPIDIMREKCAHTPLMHAIGRTLPFPRASPDPDTSERPTHLSASPGARPLPGGGTPTVVPRQKNKEGWVGCSQSQYTYLRSSTGFRASDATEPQDPGGFSAHGAPWTSPLPRLRSVWHPRVSPVCSRRAERSQRGATFLSLGEPRCWVPIFFFPSPKNAL